MKNKLNNKDLLDSVKPEMISKTFLGGLTLVLFLGLFISCKHDPEVSTVPPNSNDNNGGSSEPCNSNTVYFEQQILPLIVSSCAQPACHDADNPEDGVNLTDYNHIMQQVSASNPSGSDLWEAITDDDPQDRMPPIGENPLSNDQINLITQWINQGAQNNSCSNFCNPNSFTFSLTIQPLIATYCQGCHSGTNPDAGLVLTNYAEIQTVAANGKLINAINGTGGISLMPYQSTPLNDCQKQQITAWVDSGAPNN